MSVVSALIIIITLFSCATREKVKKAKDTEGVAIIYTVNEKQAWEITKIVFQWNNAGTLKEYPVTTPV